jgi:hypothetical protein
MSLNVTAAPDPGFGLIAADRTVELLLVAGGVIVTGLTLEVTVVVLAVAFVEAIVKVKAGFVPSPIDIPVVPPWLPEIQYKYQVPFTCVGPIPW